MDSISELLVCNRQSKQFHAYKIALAEQLAHPNWMEKISDETKINGVLETVKQFWFVMDAVKGTLHKKVGGISSRMAGGVVLYKVRISLPVQDVAYDMSSPPFGPVHEIVSVARCYSVPICLPPRYTVPTK